MLPAASGAPGHSHAVRASTSATAGSAASSSSRVASCPTAAAASCTAPSKVCSNRLRCRERPRRPVGDRFGRHRAAPRGHRPSRPRARRRVRLQPRQGRCRRRHARRSSADRRSGDERHGRRSSRSTPTSCSTPRARRSPTTRTPTTSWRCSSPARTSSPPRRTTTCPPTGVTQSSAFIARATWPALGSTPPGEHPGFMFERLAAARDRAVANEWTGSRCRSSSTAPACPGEEMLVDLMGMGKHARGDHHRLADVPCGLGAVRAGARCRRRRARVEGRRDPPRDRDGDVDP